MDTIEKFFRAHKIIFLCFAVLISPLALVWAVIYGLIIGIIGPTVDVYEIIRNKIYGDVRGVLKYPKWKAEDYKRKVMAAENKNFEEIQAVEREFEEGRRKPLGIVGYIIRDIFVFILYYPFLLLWGIMTGPIRAFLEYLKWCYRVWTGHAYSIYTDWVPQK